MDQEIERILDHLNEKRGLDFSGCRATMVERRIRKRLDAVNSPDFKQYLEFIEEHPDELNRLIDSLTISVSSFFRDALTFEFLSQHVVPLILSEKNHASENSLRVWSSGCSCGEEAYSMAILIHEAFRHEEPSPGLSIFGTDIDQEAIKKAQKAVYSFESVKNVKYGLLKAHFKVEGASYRVRPEIKQLVTFSTYDMLDTKTYVPPQSVFGSFDVVLCRNLLIYFQPETQGIIFDKLYRSLSKNGYLVLGESEVPTLKYRKLLRRVNTCCQVYQKM